MGCMKAMIAKEPTKKDGAPISSKKWNDIQKEGFVLECNALKWLYSLIARNSQLCLRSSHRSR